MEKKIADGLGSRSATRSSSTCSAATSRPIANLRTVDWQGLGINFVLVFSPNAFKGAPHTHVATLTEAHPDPPATPGSSRQVADAFPMVTSVRVREALETVGTVVTNLVLAIRGASAVTLISAILVLGGALAAGHRHRVYDAVILKTLGATRARLLGAYALEYLMIGFATAPGRRRRFIGCLHGDDGGDESLLRVAAMAGARRHTGGDGINHRVRADRHVFGTRPETRAGPASPVSYANRNCLRYLRQSAARPKRVAQCPASVRHLVRP
jgi:hypothetical protein